MARKQDTEDRADISPGLQARIVTLSEMVWEGNRSRMARELDIDQATISRVLDKKQRASAKLLENLANWPGVNVAWLLLGKGEPLSTLGSWSGVGGFRPLLDELLPGPLDENRDRLSGVSYPVAAAFASPTSYWFRVSANSPITSSQHKVQAGDHLLMETDPAWTRRSGAVTGKFCGFRVRKGKKEVVVLAWVEAHSKTSPPFDASFEQYAVDTFGMLGETWLIILTDTNEEEEARQALPHQWVTMEQVGCVCVKLERPFAKEGNRNTQAPPSLSSE